MKLMNNLIEQNIKTLIWNAPLNTDYEPCSIENEQNYTKMFVLENVPIKTIKVTDCIFINDQVTKIIGDFGKWQGLLVIPLGKYMMCNIHQK